MKLYSIVFQFLALFNTNPTYSQVPLHHLKISYVGNEGYLLTTSTHKVLIDALYSEGYGIFSVPSKELTTQIMESKAPFDSLSLLMLTHYHKDHCDPALINDYLSKHKNIPFVASKPSIVFIDGNCFGFIGKKRQFSELTPDMNQSISNIINNIPVKAFGLKHLSFYKDSIDLEETMFNVSYLFEMDGIQIFHSGDIEKNAFHDYLAKSKEWKDPIDVAFLYYGLLDSGRTDLDYIIKTLNPKYIVLMHILPAKVDEWTIKLEQLKATFSNIMFFKNTMDTKTIDIEKN